MNTNEMLASVRVASPCPTRWDDMLGKDRVRHCLRCEKHVYNFSAMTAEEIAQVVRKHEGKLCARFYRRADGTMLTADCPVGTGRFWRAVQSRFVAATALLALSASAAVALRTAADHPTHRGPDKLMTLWDNAKMKVRGWLGFKPPQQCTLGEIYVPPPKVAPPQPPQQPPKK
jgi:hypothetical protein